MTMMTETPDTAPENAPEDARAEMTVEAFEQAVIDPDGTGDVQVRAVLVLRSLVEKGLPIASWTIDEVPLYGNTEVKITGHISRWMVRGPVEHTTVREAMSRWATAFGVEVESQPLGDGPEQLEVRFTYAGVPVRLYGLVR